MESQRSHRVGEAVHHEISALLLKGLKDPRIGFVTVTGVEMTSDLHLAKVYYTVIGDEKARKDSAAGLQSSVPFIRRQLGRVLRMRFIPEVVFVYDESIEYGERIESIIREFNTPGNDDSSDS